LLITRRTKGAFCRQGQKTIRQETSTRIQRRD
jgi:hypothetical protein